MDHRLIALAKAILAEAVQGGCELDTDVAQMLRSKLPTPYTGRSVEARQWLIKEGLVRHIKANKLDQITDKCIQLIKSEGDDYFRTAKIMLQKGVEGNHALNTEAFISEDLWDNPEKNRKEIQENLNRKRSYGKNRSAQVKVSMSEDEVRLIDWLSKQGYGFEEGSRSATLRQAIADITTLVKDLKIRQINNIPNEIINRINTTTDSREVEESTGSHPTGQKIFFITDEADIKAAVKSSISLDHVSFIICIKNEASSISTKLDSLIEGVSIIYDGQIKRIDQEFAVYKVTPSKITLEND